MRRFAQGQNNDMADLQTLTAWDSLTEFILLVERFDISYRKNDNDGRYSNFKEMADRERAIDYFLEMGLVTREDYIRVWNSKVRRSGESDSYLLAEDWGK